VHDVLRDGDVLYGGAFGLIGYAADRPWINGDGVANTRGYQEAIRDHRLRPLLLRQGVRCLAVTVTPPRELTGTIVMEIPSPLFDTADTLRAEARDVALREHMRRNGGADLWLVWWNRPDR
jgi:hypothetical protein